MLGCGIGHLAGPPAAAGDECGRRQSSARGSLFGSRLGLSLCPQKCLEARWRVWKGGPRLLLTSLSHPHEGWRPHGDMVQGLPEKLFLVPTFQVRVLWNACDRPRGKHLSNPSDR